MRRNTHQLARQQRSAYLFILPALIILTVFVFIPLVSAFVISLLDANLYMTNTSFAGFKNYLNMLSDSRIWNATKNTFVFAIFEVPLQILLALLLTMLMQQNRRVHKFLRASFYVPYVCSMTAISILWSMLLNANTGFLAFMLKKVGIIMPNILTDGNYAMAVVILVTVWRNFGYTLTILTAATLDISPSIYEAAELDGAQGIRKFISITIPSIRETIGFCTITALILAFQAFDQIYVLTGGGPQYRTETLVSYIYDRGFTTGKDLGYASSVAVYLFFIIAILTILSRHFGRRKENWE